MRDVLQSNTAIPTMPLLISSHIRIRLADAQIPDAVFYQITQPMQTLEYHLQEALCVAWLPL